MMTFLAKMTVKEGREDDFVRLAKALTEKVRANEPDTLAYSFFKLRDQERGYAVYEQFASEEAEEAHQNTAYFNEIAPDLIECLDGTYVRTYLDDLD
ncbi:MAG: antibiotic biosynthesis monooxygenase [Pseudomonadota bacterium]